ncbi:MAG TPA: hypothetical protein V7792_00360 [Candidatus Azoamicus sp. OHIO2]
MPCDITYINRNILFTLILTSNNSYSFFFTYQIFPVILTISKTTSFFIHQFSLFNKLKLRTMKFLLTSVLNKKIKTPWFKKNKLININSKLYLFIK